jgi:CDP-diacylglycerol pyrophosphatase
LFGITEPSISNYTKLSGWRCNFSISDKRHEEGGYDDVLRQINSKSARNQDALSHTVDREEEAEIQIDPEMGEPQM